MSSHTHHDEPFYRKYIWSTDHKIIGLQYGFTALFFLLVGFRGSIPGRIRRWWMV